MLGTTLKADPIALSGGGDHVWGRIQPNTDEAPPRNIPGMDEMGTEISAGVRLLNKRRSKGFIPMAASYHLSFVPLKKSLFTCQKDGPSLSPATRGLRRYSHQKSEHRN